MQNAELLQHIAHTTWDIRLMVESWPNHCHFCQPTIAVFWW